MSVEELRMLAKIMSGVERVAVLTGAGISAESGVPTFRGKNGLWREFRAEDLATPEAFQRDPVLVWEWYDWRRGLMAKVKPNEGHRTLALWEKVFAEFSVITQNIDGLHLKAGSRNVVELHGNIWKTRCTEEGKIALNSAIPLKEIPPRCPSCGALLRPHVVWFGEPLDSSILNQAYEISSACEAMFVVGTSAFVQPAASLPLAAAKAKAKIIEINPDPTPISGFADFSLRGKAGEVLPMLNNYLMKFLSSPDGDIE